MTIFDRITHVGRGVFLWVSHALTARGRVPSTPQFWGSLLFLHTPFDATTKFDVVTHMGKGLVFSGQPHPRRKMI